MKEFFEKRTLTGSINIKMDEAKGIWRGDKAEIVKATAIPGAPEWKGDGIERPLGAAYDELTSK